MKLVDLISYEKRIWFKSRKSSLLFLCGNSCVLCYPLWFNHLALPRTSTKAHKGILIQPLLLFLLGSSHIIHRNSRVVCLVKSELLVINDLIGNELIYIIGKDTSSPVVNDELEDLFLRLVDR
jgi:hypothetical protein